MITQNQINQIKERIGLELAKQIKSKSLTYYRIEKETGMRQPAVQRIEQGSTAYTIDSLIKLCLVLGIEVIEIKS